MIGIRDEDYDLFAGWSNAMISAEGQLDNPEIAARATKAYMAYAAYVGEIIEDRRKHPQDDLVSILTGAKDDGLLVHYDEDVSASSKQRRPENMHLANDELIKLHGNPHGRRATRPRGTALSGSIELLIQAPRDIRQRLEEHPSKIRNAVEEMLRLVTPVHSFGRTVLKDTELRGRKIKAGDKILLLYGSANRDPKAFEDPERFDIDRRLQHVAFGIGNHFCLGANLARMELRVALEQVLKRMPNMEFADEHGAVLQPSSLVRTCASMRVRFTPELA